MTPRRNVSRSRNIGLLILRAGLGIIFILRGHPKISGGPEAWEQYGAVMQTIGLDFAPLFFGFLIGIVELFGGICLALGVFFTPAVASLLAITLISLIQNPETELLSTSSSAELSIVLFSLLFIGAGRYSLEQRLGRRKRRSLFP